MGYQQMPLYSITEMFGEASRYKQGGRLPTVPGLRLGTHIAQLCLCFFGSIAANLAKQQDSMYPAWVLSSLKALLKRPGLLSFPSCLLP